MAKRKVVIIELNVPSGEMVFSDGLPGFFVPGEYEVNTEAGTINKTKAMERIGCAYGYVGNSCPIVYRIDGRNLLVAAIMSERRKNKPKKIAQIVTDHWWYGFADAVEFERRTGLKRTEYDRVAVNPGVYRFTHMLPGESDARIYAKIAWVREPDPVKDYLAEYRTMNFTAGQVIRDMMLRWPRLFEGPNALMRAATHIICTMDGGRFWHANGFPQFNPDIFPEIEDMEIPVFDQPFDWYPMYEECALVRAANEEIHFNPSFASLAKNVARCIIKHGSGRHTGNPKIAQECLEKLDILYPGI